MRAARPGPLRARSLSLKRRAQAADRPPQPRALRLKAGYPLIALRHLSPQGRDQVSLPPPVIPDALRTRLRHDPSIRQR